MELFKYVLIYHWWRPPFSPYPRHVIHILRPILQYLSGRAYHEDKIFNITGLYLYVLDGAVLGLCYKDKYGPVLVNIT